MFRLFGRKKTPDALPTTGGRLVYAVGDVHGRLDLLGPLLRDIAEDALAAQPAERPLLVMLGDDVDRGPDSKGVVDLLLEMQTYSRIETRTLKGNHEEALLRFLEDPAFGPTWAENAAARRLRPTGSSLRLRAPTPRRGKPPAAISAPPCRPRTGPSTKAWS